MELRINGVEKESVVDGPGIRYVIFTQGCTHSCKGCHNPNTHDLKGGELVKLDTLLADIKQTKLLQGVTFSGGEPFLQSKALADLGRRIKEEGLDIVTYTGFLFEELLEKTKIHPEYLKLLQVTDLLIDGPFLLELRDLSLPFRGSANQRIIDIPRFFKEGVVVLK